MRKTVYGTIDAGLAALMTIPVIGGVVAIVKGTVEGSTTSLWFGGGLLTYYLLVLWAFMLPTSYAIDEIGLHVRAGRLKLRVPLHRLITARIWRRPLGCPAFSPDRIEVAYLTREGRASSVLISPPDPDVFLADLARAVAAQR